MSARSNSTLYALYRSAIRSTSINIRRYDMDIIICCSRQIQMIWCRVRWKLITCYSTRTCTWCLASNITPASLHSHSHLAECRCVYHGFWYSINWPVAVRQGEKWQMLDIPTEYIAVTTSGRGFMHGDWKGSSSYGPGWSYSMPDPTNWTTVTRPRRSVFLSAQYTHGRITESFAWSTVIDIT